MRVVCFGELLLRLSSPVGELMLQSPHLNACVGGAEANVAVSLACLGHEVSMVSALPDNALGHAARRALQMHGVDTRAIRAAHGRMGLYFLTPGAVLRPSEIVYDRSGSAFAHAEPGAYDWPALLEDASWLHISGVTPAVGPQGEQAALAAMQAARGMGVLVSFDGNYRATMWAQRGTDGAGVLKELLACADLAFVDQRDIALILQRPELAASRAAAMEAAFAAFPNLQWMAATTRTQLGNDHHVLGAAMYPRGTPVITAGDYELRGIVDRIGTGDAFAAGVLHGFLRQRPDADALGFGLAAAAFKHSVAGDFNLASEAQIDMLAAGALDVRR